MCILWVRYATSNLYFPNVVRVRILLKEEMEKGDGFMKNMVAIMYGKYEKYYAEFSTIMAIAIILDSRYKFQFPEWAYKRIYGPDHVIELSLLKDKLFCLFDEYSKSTKGSATDIPSSNCEAANVGKVSNPLMQVCCFLKEYQ